MDLKITGGTSDLGLSSLNSCQTWDQNADESSGKNTVGQQPTSLPGRHFFPGNSICILARSQNADESSGIKTVGQQPASLPGRHFFPGLHLHFGALPKCLHLQNYTQSRTNIEGTWCNTSIFKGAGPNSWNYVLCGFTPPIGLQLPQHVSLGQGTRDFSLKGLWASSPPSATSSLIWRFQWWICSRHHRFQYVYLDDWGPPHFGKRPCK